MNKRLAIVVAALGVAAIAGWASFHPEHRPDPSQVSAAVRQELAKTGFKATQAVSTAQFKSTDTLAGVTDDWRSEQRIAAVDELLTEKRSHRRSAGIAEQVHGLYAGPITVVRYQRVKPPIVGDLLPYQFWSAETLSALAVEEVVDFPATKGGRLRARATYHDQYADGETLQTETRRLHCDVKDVVDAASIHAQLSGKAARIECREELEPGTRKPGAANPQTWTQSGVVYAHWYILDRHWSIANDGEFTLTFAGMTETRKWTSRLVSFETGR